MNADEIRELMVDRMAVIAPFVQEYVQLVEADRMLGTLLNGAGPPPPQLPRRKRGRPPRALQEARKAQRNGGHKPEVATLHVQTITMPRREFEDRELAWTTQEPEA